MNKIENENENDEKNGKESIYFQFLDQFRASISQRQIILLNDLKAQLKTFFLDTFKENFQPNQANLIYI